MPIVLKSVSLNLLELSEPVIGQNGGCFARCIFLVVKSFIVSIQYTASAHMTFQLRARKIAGKGRIRNEENVSVDKPADGST